MKKSVIIAAVIVAAIAAGVFLDGSSHSVSEEALKGSFVQINLAEVEHTAFISSFKVDASSIENGRQGTITWVKTGSLLDKKGVKIDDAILSMGNGNGIMKILSF